MLNFTFHNPTKIVFGKGQIEKLATEIPKDAKVLVTYGGGSIKKNGIFQQVSTALQGHEYLEFPGSEPNPKYDTLIKAIDIIREHDIDFLLAVGGGSVIDGTKFISAAACYQGEDPWDILAKRHPIESALPIGAVLTLPATGSESNGGSVVTRDGNKLAFGNPLVRPVFAVLDPAASLSLSDRQVSNGIVDAFVHTIEQYLTFPVNGKVQDRFAEGLLLTLIEEGPIALSEKGKNDPTVRANIMWSASLALNGLIGSGVPQDWATHMIGHELTGAHGIDHARTLSIILPAVMKVCRDDKRDKLLQYAERVWELKNGNEEARIDQAIQLTEDFFKRMNMPTRLSDVQLDASNIDKLIQKLELHGMTSLGEHRNVTLDVSRRVLEQAL